MPPLIARSRGAPLLPSRGVLAALPPQTLASGGGVASGDGGGDSRRVEFSLTVGPDDSEDPDPTSLDEETVRAPAPRRLLDMTGGTGGDFSATYDADDCDSDIDLEVGIQHSIASF